MKKSFGKLPLVEKLKGNLALDIARHFQMADRSKRNLVLIDHEVGWPGALFFKTSTTFQKLLRSFIKLLYIAWYTKNYQNGPGDVIQKWSIQTSLSTKLYKSQFRPCVRSPLEPKSIATCLSHKWKFMYERVQSIGTNEQRILWYSLLTARKINRRQ